MTDATSPLRSDNPAQFMTTHWSLVLAAGQRRQPDAEAALERLCRTYWMPLYAYVRRSCDSHEAQDLVQGFFTRLLEKDLLALADPRRGRFRAFLLTALKHFMANEWARDRAQKRGGAQTRLALDFDSGESRYSMEPAHDLSAERLFERQWALTLLDQTLALLRAEQAAAGKLEQFELLKPCLGAERAESYYTEAAKKLDMTEGAARVAAHRLRKRYRELLRQELRQTVADPADIDDEVRQLFAALDR